MVCELHINEPVKKYQPMHGVPFLAQWDRWPLESAGSQVPSPLQHSGLRICHCHSCSLDCDCGLDLIPGLGTPYAVGQPKMKEKNKHTNKQKKKTSVIYCIITIKEKNLMIISILYAHLSFCP